MSLSSSLQTHFGFDAFRTGQEEAIQSLLDKNHTLAIMPTGAGKSLIYQLAALQFDGLALVISPLIALMKDGTARCKRVCRRARTPPQHDLPPLASILDCEPARRG